MISIGQRGRFWLGVGAVVALSRIYLGVHYPTDVIAGWLIGTGWALTCWLVVELMRGRRRAE